MYLDKPGSQNDFENGSKSRLKSDKSIPVSNLKLQNRKTQNTIFKLEIEKKMYTVFNPKTPKTPKTKKSRKRFQIRNRKTRRNRKGFQTRNCKTENFHLVLTPLYKISSIRCAYELITGTCVYDRIKLI